MIIPEDFLYRFIFLCGIHTVYCSSLPALQCKIIFISIRLPRSEAYWGTIPRQVGTGVPCGIGNAFHWAWAIFFRNANGYPVFAPAKIQAYMSRPLGSGIGRLSS